MKQKGYWACFVFWQINALKMRWGQFPAASHEKITPLRLENIDCNARSGLALHGCTVNDVKLQDLIILLTRLGNSLSNYMILLVQEIDIANLGEIYHLDPSGGSRDAENPEEPS